MQEYEKIIAEIREAVINYPNNLEKIQYCRNEIKAYENIERNKISWLNFLLVELEQKQKENLRVRESLSEIINELNQRFDESWRKWKTEADMYEQGRADAYDEIDTLINDTLKRLNIEIK